MDDKSVRFLVTPVLWISFFLVQLTHPTMKTGLDDPLLPPKSGD